MQKHPHMRGEDRSPFTIYIGHVETPPHAWGRPDPDLPTVRSDGNTPTCVGKTRESITRASISKKHPHMRGEDGNESATA